MLVYCRGTFMQALEGPPPAVETTFQRIARDARHHSVEVITDAACDDRDFAQWWMGFATLDAPEASTRPEFADVFGAGFSPALFAGRAGKALKLLQQFAQPYRR